MVAIFEKIKEIELYDRSGEVQKIHELESEIIDLALTQKHPVIIRYNDETGEYNWAVEIQGTDFWIDAFENKADAIEFCEEEGLPVVNVFE